MKKALLLFALCGIAILAGSHEASAFPAGGVYGRDDYNGYFTNSQDTAGTFVFLSGIPSGVDTAAEFISFIQDNLANGTAQEKTGAAFIVNTMLGNAAPGDRTPTAAMLTDWRSRVNSRALKSRINWNVSYNYTVNSYYQGSTTNDDAFYDDAGTAASIVFYNDAGSVVYAIKRNCGNPVGGPFSSLPRSWALNGDTAVSATTAAPGQTITFSHRVSATNSAPYNGTVPDNMFQWKVQYYNYAASGAQLAAGDLTSLAYSNAQAAGTTTTYSTRSFTVPAGAALDSRYCQRVYFDPRASDNGNPEASAVDCVTVKHIYVDTRMYVDVNGDNSYTAGTDQLVQTPPTNCGSYYSLGGTGSNIRNSAGTDFGTTPYNMCNSGPVNRDIVPVGTYTVTAVVPAGWVVTSSPLNFTASGPGSHSIWHRIRQNPPSCSLTPASQNIPQGSSANISWTTANATSMSVRNVSTGAVIGSGLSGTNVSTGNLNATTNFEGTATNVGGSATCGNTVLVDAPSCVLTPATQRIARGTAANIGWTTASGTAMTVRNRTTGAVVGSGLSGSNVSTGPLSADTTFEGTVTNASGATNTCTNTVTVYTAVSCWPATTSIAAPGGPVTFEARDGDGGTYTWSSGGSDVATGMTYTKTYSGPTYDTVTVRNSDGNAAQCTVGVYNEPYVVATGSDVRTGAKMTSVGSTDECNVSPDLSVGSRGGVSAYNAGAPSYYGSGSQLGVMSNNSITEFVSAALRTSPGPASGLTFANSNTAELYGNSFGDGSSCLGDLWDASAIPSGSTTSSAIAGSSVAAGTKSVYYVNGNLNIDSNITYASTWSSVADIPSVSIYVKGNIYISAGVTNIDANLYALPTSSSAGGDVYTCANGSVAYTTQAEVYTNCVNRLVFNGAVVARKLYLLRMFGHTAAATARLDSANAAEVFNSGPETWLVGVPDAGSGSIELDAFGAFGPTL